MKKISILLALLAPAHLLSAEVKEVSLFDGKTLDGWVVVNPANAKYWSVVDGVITASNGAEKMPTNTFLATERNYQNFEFRCLFRLSGDHKTGLINSGIQYRSVLQKLPKPPGAHHIIGYQADIGKGYWGDIYDEHRRGKLVGGKTDALFKDFKEDRWNEYLIRCNGDEHQLVINGHVTVNYTEPDPAIPDFGVIALQLHSGGVAKMEYKDITIKEHPGTKMALPKILSAREAKIHGQTMALQQNTTIVSWNKINEFIEWTIPGHFRPGAYAIHLNYSCDTGRQGSEMAFSNGRENISFQTKGTSPKWGPVEHSIGSMKLAPGDKITLKCGKLHADWVLDFHHIRFEAR